MMNMRVVLLKIKVIEILKTEHIAAERGHMCMMIKMRDLFGFVKDYIWFRI